MRPQVSAACLTSRRLLHQKQRAQLQGERAIAARQAAPTFGRQAAFLQSLCLGLLRAPGGFRGEPEGSGDGKAGPASGDFVVDQHGDRELQEIPPAEDEHP